MENNIMALVGAFIGIAILLGIGTQILGNSVQDCSVLPGYPNGPWDVLPSTDTNDANTTGWAAQCVQNNTNTQNAYTLIMIVLIVIAAVVILSVVRML